MFLYLEVFPWEVDKGNALKLSFKYFSLSYATLTACFTFRLSCAPQITRRDEEMSPFITGSKRSYIFGGICSVAANASIKVCMLNINSYYIIIIQLNFVPLTDSHGISLANRL